MTPTTTRDRLREWATATIAGCPASSPLDVRPDQCAADRCRSLALPGLGFCSACLAEKRGEVAG